MELLAKASAWVGSFNQVLIEVLVFLLLPVAAKNLLEWLVSKKFFPVVLKWLGVAVFFVVLGFLIWTISTEPRSSKVLGRLHGQGIHWPIVYTISLLYFAIACFTALLILINEKWGGIAPKSESGIRAVEYSSLMDLFLWHFLSAIPIFKVPDTLLLKPKYEHTTFSIGLVLLVFKIAVIAPLIAAFAVWFRLVQ